MIPDPVQFRRELAADGGGLWEEIEALCRVWTSGTRARLQSRTPYGRFPKSFNDPVWGVIELMPWEILILDSPMMQRLRGIHQLGMAHLVYPGAVHDRLEHSRGTVEAAERMMRALDHNRTVRRKFGGEVEREIPEISELDRVSTRLAALLHDVGHGPFSHATEPLIEVRWPKELRAVADRIRCTFDGVTRIAPAEVVSVLVVMSESLRGVFSHERFEAARERVALPIAIAARILGSRSCLDAEYLSGVVSGPIDADKLDYMARDAHHAGLPLGIDVDRLISRLEVVVVTPENAPPREGLRERAESSPNRRFYDIGISESGIGAYEQLVIGRVILFDRLYYHHKVRAAEAMTRRLVTLAEEERGAHYSISQFSFFGDDAFVSILGGATTSERMPAGGEHSRALAAAILDRDIYHRAFAFAARFIAGLDELDEQQQYDTRALALRRMFKPLGTPEGVDAVENKIYRCALRIMPHIQDRMDNASRLRPEHVLVDLPLNRVVVRGGDILTTTYGNRIGTPNLFFDPERWSQAYEQQKRCGFVFAPREFVPLIALASRIVFFEEFGLVMGEAADRAAKTVGVVPSEWIPAIERAGAISAACARALVDPRFRFLMLFPSELRLPDQWGAERGPLATRLADAVNEAFPEGLPTNTRAALVEAIDHLTAFVDMVEKGGSFVGRESLPEADLQSKLRDHLRSRCVVVREGESLGGGKADLVLPGDLVIENKVIRETSDPMASGPHYEWQARRYSIALDSRISIIVVGYKPASEASLLPLPERIRGMPSLDGMLGRLQIRVAVPFGHPVPSKVKTPPGP